jgi:hypothetical protein
MKALKFAALCFATIAIAGCGPDGATPAEIETAIQQCVAKGEAQFQPPAIDVSAAGPGMRAALEQQAKAGIAKIAAEHKQQVEQVCRESIPKVCAQSRELCKSQ